MGHGNFQPFLGAQTHNAAMEQKNCPQINHPQNRIMRSNRKKERNKKKNLNSGRNNSTSFFRPPVLKYSINRENNNQQNNFNTTANVSNATQESQLLSIGNRGNRNDNTHLIECGSNQTNLQHLTISKNQTNSSTNSNLNTPLLNVASGINKVGLDLESRLNIYNQNENFADFAKEDSSSKTKFNVFDGVLKKPITDVDSMQPLDIAQLPDASRKHLLLNAQNTTTLVIRNKEGEENTFTLQTICEWQDENDKDVILLLAAPEVQEQITQGNVSVDGVVEAETVQTEENAPEVDPGTIENTYISNENDLHFEQNNTMENCQEVQNNQNDSNTTYKSNTDKHYRHDIARKKSKSRKRKHQRASSHTQTRCKKFIGSNSEAETALLQKETGQSNLTKTYRCLPRRRIASFNPLRWRQRSNLKNNRKLFKCLQNQYFSRFAKEYFKKKHINDKELRKLMMIVLYRVGGNVMKSIWCFFEALRRNYNASRTG